MNRATFHFEIWYFKASGKLYIAEIVSLEVDCIFNGGVMRPYMYDALDAIKRMQHRGQLPGLENGKWDDAIVINSPQGFPIMIPPRK